MVLPLHCWAWGLLPGSCSTSWLSRILRHDTFSRIFNREREPYNVFRVERQRPEPPGRLLELRHTPHPRHIQRIDGIALGGTQHLFVVQTKGSESEEVGSAASLGCGQARTVGMKIVVGMLFLHSGAICTVTAPQQLSCQQRSGV